MADVPLLSADPSDDAAMDKVIGSARVVLTLAGPYARYGAPVVAAAVRNKTDYCDITGAERTPLLEAHCTRADCDHAPRRPGEPQFMLENVKRHHEAAKANGAW